MKFFKAEYWQMLNSDNAEERELGSTQWAGVAKKYTAHFDEIQGKLPKSFVKAYHASNCFHDSTIANICITNFNKNVCDLDLELCDGKNTIVLQYRKVSNLIMDIPKYHSWLGGKMSWGYGEIYENGGGGWEHHILCDVDCEFQITFQQLSVARKSKD